MYFDVETFIIYDLYVNALWNLVLHRSFKITEGVNF